MEITRKFVSVRNVMRVLAVISTLCTYDAASITDRNDGSGAGNHYDLLAAKKNSHEPEKPLLNSTDHPIKEASIPPAYISKRLLDKCADNHTKLYICEKLKAALQRKQVSDNSTDRQIKNATIWRGGVSVGSHGDTYRNSSYNATVPTEETQIVQSADGQVIAEDGDEAVRSAGDAQRTNPNLLASDFGKLPGRGSKEEYMVPSNYSRGGVGHVGVPGESGGVLASPEIDEDEETDGDSPEEDSSAEQVDQTSSSGCSEVTVPLTVDDWTLGSVGRFFSLLLAAVSGPSQPGETGRPAYNFTQVALQGRARIKRIFGHMSTLVLMKAVALGAVLLGAVKLVAGKALLLSSASFLLAAVLGLKRLYGGGKAVIVHAHKTSVGPPLSHAWEDHHEGWDPYRASYHRREAAGGHPYSAYYDMGAAPGGGEHLPAFS